jgi:hypothetical protein
VTLNWGSEIRENLWNFQTTPKKNYRSEKQKEKFVKKHSEAFSIRFVHKLNIPLDMTLLHLEIIS